MDKNKNTPNDAETITKDKKPIGGMMGGVKAGGTSTGVSPTHEFSETVTGEKEQNGGSSAAKAHRDQNT